jgi:hypothetical protein
MQRLLCSSTERDGGETYNFHPTFTHQQFGEDETIKGYSDLKITVCMSADMLHANLDVAFKAKADSADDIRAQLEVDKLTPALGKLTLALPFQNTLPNNTCTSNGEYGNCCFDRLVDYV